MAVVQPQWMTLMQVTNAHLRLAIKTNDFSHFDAQHKLYQNHPGAVLNFHKLLGDSNDTSSLSPDTKKMLDNSCQDRANSAKDLAQSFSTSIKQDANNAPPQNSDQIPAWKQQMIDQNNKDKQTLDAATDKSLNDAMNKIGQLPAAEQAPAATAWTTAQSWVSNVVKQAIQFLVQHNLVSDGCRRP